MVSREGKFCRADQLIAGGEEVKVESEWDVQEEEEATKGG